MMDLEPKNPWLAYRQRSRSPRLRLFCFPHAGGGGSAYRGWAEKLSAEVDLCPVQFPGRETRLQEAPFRRMAPLVEAASESLLPYFDRPFCLFGHSMGALVAFALARHLRARYALAPARLFVSAHAAPHLPDPYVLRSDLSEEDFLEAVVQLEGTPKEVFDHPELLELMLPLLRADCEICDTYQYSDEPPFGFPISVYGGSDDIEVSRDALEAWREQTRSTCDVRIFPGSHFYLQTAQQQVLQALSEDLEPLLATASPPPISGDDR
jgi:medium-chain acyl-[acyl-carrier-protein] hydrolase